MITGEDGRKTVELITAIYKAGFIKQIVTLPIEKMIPIIHSKAYLLMQYIFMRRHLSWKISKVNRLTLEIINKSE